MVTAFTAVVQATSEYKRLCARSRWRPRPPIRRSRRWGRGAQAAVTFGLNWAMLRQVKELIRGGICAVGVARRSAYCGRRLARGADRPGLASRRSRRADECVWTSVRRPSRRWMCSTSRPGMAGRRWRNSPCAATRRDLRSGARRLQRSRAALTVMTSASGDAAGAAGALSKILLNLSKADVQKRLHDLGIEATGVARNICQARRKGTQRK